MSFVKELNVNSTNYDIIGKGIVDGNTSATSPIYNWSGTLAEYQDQNIATLHPEWVCYITDDNIFGNDVYTKTETDTLLNNKQNTLTAGSNIYIIDNVISAAGSSNVTPDNFSITYNGSGYVQSAGTINKNSASGATNPVFDWVGTEAEYTAQNIGTLHPEWVCFITDDTADCNIGNVYSISQTDTLLNLKANTATTYTKTEVDNIFATLYPVGSIYIGTQATCPLSSIIPGSTWTLVSNSRVLQGSDSNHSAGTTIAAGLPNITGSFEGRSHRYGAGLWNATGSFSITSGSEQSLEDNYGSGATQIVNLNASSSSSIYGNSTTVQPPAYVVNIWQRTA